MKNKKQLIDPIRYFFRHMERRHFELENQRLLNEHDTDEVVVEDIETFFRAIKTQNIFMFTVGLGGKPESTILSKAIYSLNKVVKVYYSTSFDESCSGYIRIRPDPATQTIVIERMHGYRPVAEFLYRSKKQCQIVRYMVEWIMKRIDWNKTRLENLEMYRQFVEERQILLEQRIVEAEKARQAEILESAMAKHSVKRKVLSSQTHQAAQV